MIPTPDTLTAVLSRLQAAGYTTDFRRLTDRLTCQQGEYGPDTFIVEETYRFEGPSDPADEAILYAIQTKDGQIRGTLVDGYGIYSDLPDPTLSEKLRTGTRIA